MKTYTAKTLLATYRWARTHPDGIIPIDRFERLTGNEWLRWFRQCLDRKASRGLNQHGRKWSNEWFMQAWRTSREVNQPRLIVQWIPYEFRERLQHRIYTD